MRFLFCFLYLKTYLLLSNLVFPRWCCWSRTRLPMREIHACVFCCWCSVAQSCATLWNPMDFSTPFLSVPHNLLETAPVYVHCISDAVQPSHPLTCSYPSALNLSQLQGLFQWVVCSRQMTKILELQLQHLCFQWIFRVDLSQDGLAWSPSYLMDFHESSQASQF